MREGQATLHTDDGYKVRFIFSDTSEVIGRTIILYESPYIDGAFSDDTGAAVRQFTFTAKFRGADYTKHLEFAEKLASYNRLWTLEHPNYNGVFQGRVERASISHDKSLTACSINIEFVETIDDKLDVMPVMVHIERNTYETSRKAIEKRKKDLKKAAKTSSDTGWLALLEERVATLEARAAEIAAPANSITADMKTLDSLSDRMASAVMMTVEAYIAAEESLSSTPELIVSIVLKADEAINTIMDILKPPTEMVSQFHTSLAMVYAVLSGAYFARRLQADYDARNAQLSYEAVDSWTNSGEYLPPRSFDSASSAPEYLSTVDLQKALYFQADLVDKAAKLARENDEDDEGSRLLAAHMRAIADFIHNMIIQTGSIKEIDLGDDMIPLFILLQREGLSYKAADRVHALNPHIECPTFYTGKVKIYER